MNPYVYPPTWFSEYSELCMYFIKVVERSGLGMLAIEKKPAMLKYLSKSGAVAEQCQWPASERDDVDKCSRELVATRYDIATDVDHVLKTY